MIIRVFDSVSGKWMDGLTSDKIEIHGDGVPIEISENKYDYLEIRSKGNILVIIPQASNSIRVKAVL